jgi:hypothetical protein
MESTVARIDVEKSAYHHQSQNEAVIWNFAYLLDCRKPAVPLFNVVASFSAMSQSILCSSPFAGSSRISVKGPKIRFWAAI